MDNSTVKFVGVLFWAFEDTGQGPLLPRNGHFSPLD